MRVLLVFAYWLLIANTVSGQVRLYVHSMGRRDLSFRKVLYAAVPSKENWREEINTAAAKRHAERTLPYFKNIMRTDLSKGMVQYAACELYTKDSVPVAVYEFTYRTRLAARAVYERMMKMALPPPPPVQNRPHLMPINDAKLFENRILCFAVAPLAYTISESCDGEASVSDTSNYHFTREIADDITRRYAKIRQHPWVPITIDTNIRDTFTFAKKWAYKWYIFKEDDGHFTSAMDDKISRADTAHQYFTANCTTNLQGGYYIRYCNAVTEGDELVLTLADGLPAYASSFHIHMYRDSFYVEPETHYPAPSRGWRMKYRIDKQNLTINRMSHKPGQAIMGYIDFTFTEVYTKENEVDKAPEINVHGYIRTRVE